MQGSYLSPGEDTYGPSEAPESEEEREARLLSFVRHAVSDAEQFVDDELAPERALATKYYLGEQFGNEEDGRSKVVLTDVRDTVQAIMPSLMRVFFGSERVVEFVPHGPEDIAAAEQATDYINYVVTKDNPGFETFYAAFKDALVRKTGIIKWFWDDRRKVSTHTFSNLDQMAVAALLQEPDVTVVESSQDPATGLYSLTLRREKKIGRPAICAVPPEELLVNRKARSLQDALVVTHRTDKTRSELVAMGYSEDDLATLSFRSELLTNEERLARQAGVDFNDSSEDTSANNVITYYESWLRYDFDGDGIAELMRVCLASNQLLHYEPADEVPFAIFCPDPEPHRFFGLSMADYTMDLQLIKSTVFRNMLDSLAQSINPRVAAVEGQVNMQDLLNNEVGGIVRMRAPGMVQSLDMPFVGQAAFPMLAYLDEIREQRTGMSKASLGLDADALQSTTKAAVSATVSAAQQHIELICRIFAETGMKDLFRGLLRMSVRHPEVQRMVRLRNEWVQVDPRAWDADMDVTVNVALGYGTNEERISVLMGVAAKQEQVMQVAGFDNPLVGAENLFYTYGKILELSGYKDVSRFFRDPAQYEPPPPQPDPAQMLAELQMEQMRADMAVKGAELDIKKRQIALEQDFKRDQLDADIILRSRELEMKYQQAVDVEKIKAELTATRADVATITQ